jgi:hypothetical protein
MTENIKQQNKNYLGKTIAGLAIFTAGMIAGDTLDANKQFFQPLKYFKQPIAENSPRDYWNYTTKLVEENGELTLYFGNKSTNEFLPVRENGLVGTMYDNLTNIAEELSKELGFDELKNNIEKKVQEFKEE